MLSKLSVKKPYTVLVSVVLVLVLGIISFMNMTTDLLPSLDLPYVIVITSYPGASPEKVEQTVTKPLESALGTTSGIKKVTSTSSENMSMVMLEFEQTTNMDSAMIAISGGVDLVTPYFDDMVGAPMLMKISPDMMPIMVASVDMDGKDIKEISAFVENEILPEFERIDGVASVEATGLIEERVVVTLNQTKIDAINDRVLGNIDTELLDAQNELRDGKNEIASGKQEVEDGLAALTTQKEDTINKLASASAELDKANASLAGVESEKITLGAIKAERDGLQAALDGYNMLNNMLAQARATALEQAKAALLAQINAALASAGQPEAPDYDTAVALYNAMNAAMGGTLPVLPDPNLIAASVPASVEELIALTPEAFEAFKAQMGTVPEVASLTQESLQQMKSAADLAALRIPEIATAYPGLDTRLADLETLGTYLKDQIAALQKAYAELEAGKLTAVAEFTKGEVGLETAKGELEKAQTELDKAQEQFDDARDEAYKQADLGGIITKDTISGILMAENFNMPAGYLVEDGTQYLVKVGDAFESIDEVEDAMLFHIDVDGVGDIRLSDVADIEVKDNSDESYANVNGNSAVTLSFQKQSTASTADVSNKINETMASLEANYEGLHVSALMDQGDYIRMIINSVLSNLVWGGLLSVLVLALFLKDFRPTLIVACSIPFSLMCAITAMYFSNITLNIISLSGLALGVGMLVDNSIVAIENIYRLRNEGMTAAKAAVLGAKQISGAIFASTLTTICVFLPIVFTEGISRQLFVDMGLTIAYSLLASLFVALTLVPAMGATVLRNTSERPHKWFDKFTNAYLHVLKWSLRHKIVVLAGVAFLLFFSLWQATIMGTAFMPEMNSPQMSVAMTMPDEASQDDGYAMADTVVDRISSIEGVDLVGAIGSGGGGIMSMAGGGDISFYVLLADDTNKKNTDVEQEIYDATADLECEISVTASTMDMSALGGSGMQVVITGQDLDEMRAVADDMRALLRPIEGVSEVSEEEVSDTMETRIIVNKDLAVRNGLTVAQVYSEIAEAIETQKTATTLSVDGTNYEVIVENTPESALTRATLMDYTFDVTKQDGTKETVRLGDIATSEQTTSVASISRDSGSRTMSVNATIGTGYNVGLVSREAQSLLDGYEAPYGCTVSIAGEAETINSAMFDLALMMLLAVVFIYLIMVAQFQSLMSPFIVMFTIPLAFTGGLLALWITGSDLSVISILGFLVLAGVVVNNGIVFVDSINQLRLEGLSRHDAIVRTASMRVRPVLMTALTTILAMSTMAMGIGQGAEMTQPMAIVTIGGLTYATVLTLVVVPVLYDIMRKKDLKKVDVDDV